MHGAPDHAVDVDGRESRWPAFDVDHRQGYDIGPGMIGAPRVLPAHVDIVVEPRDDRPGNDAGGHGAPVDNS